MKTLNRMVLCGGLLMLLGAGASVAHSADAAQAIKDHKALAAAYEGKAELEDGVIDQHERMKINYKNDSYVNEQVTPSSRLRTLNGHCNAIIADATKLRDEYRQFARWHKMRAAELEGK